MTTYFVLKILHLVASAAWLGAAMWVPGDVRRTLPLGPSHLPALAARVRPAVVVHHASGVAALATGLALMLATGPYPVNIHIGLAVTLVMLVLGFALLGPAANRVAAAARGGADPAALAPAAKKLAAASGVNHLLWLVVVVLMVWR